MLLNSPAFTHEGAIPQKYTADGDGINPPLKIQYVPNDAKSLAIIVEDPDAPGGTWTHWLIWNIPTTTTLEITEGVAPTGVVGKNSGGENSWYPINPPDGEHRYFFRLFALDTELELDPQTATPEEFHNAVEEHTLAKTELMGKYHKVAESA
jgi:Raf kinase inhibitor-like YbhB/YbcL family protein